MPRFTTPLASIIDLPVSLDAVYEAVGDLLQQIGVTELAVNIIDGSGPSTPAPAPIPFPPGLNVLGEPPDDPEDVDGPFPPEPDTGTVPIPSGVYVPSGFSVTVGLQALSDVVIDLAGLDGLSLVINPGEFSATATFIGTHFSNVTCQIDVALRFGRDFLMPVRRVDPSSTDVQFEDDPTRQYTQINVASLRITIDADGEFQFEGGIAARLTEPVMIGSTGAIIESADIALNLTGDGARPAGTPANWKGLLINGATVRLPQSFSGAITATGLGIGSGGISGTIQGNFALNYAGGEFTGDLAGEVFGMPGGISEISLSLQQNIPSGGGIRAQFLLPFFDETDQPLDIDITIAADGSIAAGIHSGNGLATLRVEGVVELRLSSVEMGFDDGVFTIVLAGQITPLIAGIAWPTFQIDALTIDSEGHVKLDGGWLDFPTPLSFELYGFRAECARIGFGTEPDGRRWIGFDASLQFIQSFALGGTVEGCKIKWKGSDITLSIRGVGIELLIPNALYLNGKVEFIDDGTRKGFKGGVQLRVLPANLAIDAQLLIGRNSQVPAYNFAYTYISLELPVGIPILNTGLALFGGAGLGGYNVAPNKLANQTWFEWYMQDPPGVSDVDKWTDQRDAFAVGVGVIIGTVSDNGYAFNGRFLLVLVLPGPLLLLDGQASFLKKRGTGQPNLYSLAIWDGNAGTLLFNVAANYKYTEDGDLIDITGGAEAFFDFGRPKLWHFYLGMDSPESKRIRANIVKLFEANAYFMLNNSGVRMGAWFGIDRKWKYGPLKVSLEAWLQGSADVSWSPAQFQGNITLHGDVGLKAFGYGAGLNLQSTLEVRAPRTYRVHADFEVKMSLPWPLPDPKAHIKMTWEQEAVPTPPKPLEVLGVEHLKVTEKWPMSSSVTDAPIVPLDAKPVLSFQRRMLDDTGIAANALPGGNERVGSYRFRYRLTSVQLEKRASAGEAWVDATTPPTPFLPAGTLSAQWLAVPATDTDSSPQGVASMTKLMLWSRTPFDYGRESTGTAVVDGFLDDNRAWPCGYNWNPIEQCVDFQDLNPGPMPNLVSLGALSIVSRDVVIEPSSGDWIDVGQVALIEGLAQRRLVGLMRLVFPPSTALVYLYVGKGTDGAYQVPGQDEQPLKFASEPIPVDAGNEDIPYVDLAGQVILLRVCWVSRDEWDRTADGQDASDNMVPNAVNAMTADAELLQPHRQYRMTVLTTTERSSDGGNSWQAVDSNSDVGYFQTQSAPGLATDSSDDLQPNENSEHYPSRGPLKDLTPYVHRTIPDNGARPVYRSYDVGIEMNEAYTEPMYLLEGTPLVLQLHDSNGLPASEADGEPLNLMGQWQPLEDAQLGEVARDEESDWMDYLAGAGCTDPGVLNGAQPPAAEGIWISHPRLLLEPQTVYRAVLGPVIPTAVIPLKADGSVEMDGLGRPRVTQLAGTASDRLEQIAAASDGNKLLVTSAGVVETSLGADAGAHGVPQRNKRDVSRLADLAVLEVAPPSEELVRVYDWTFTTSRFATFTHHMHSFHDAAGSLYAQSGFPGDLFTAAELQWLQDLVSALPSGAPRYNEDERQLRRDEEGQRFDRVFAVLGMEGNALPDSVSITVVDDVNRSYALLLESPEPIAWERLTLAVHHGNVDFGHALASDSPLKIIAAGFAQSDQPADLVDEFVEVLVLESVNVAGVELALEDGTGNWQSYFTFSDDGVTPEGTVLRVHTGSAVNDPEPMLECEHRYAEDEGGQAARQFQSNHVTVRLLDADGSELHQRSFFTQKLSSSQYKILRSRDGTRALLFFRNRRISVGSIPSGSLQMSWSFERNIMPEEPILRRMGSDNAETIEIVVAPPA